MNTEELLKRDKNELKKMIQDLNKKLNDIRFKKASNKLKNVNEIRNVKKEIARILTIINRNSKEA